VPIPLRLPDRPHDGVVVLDGYTLADAEAHWESEDEEIWTRFSAPRHSTQDEVRAAIERWIAARAASGNPNFCYAIRAADAVVGGCELRWLDSENGSVAVSYWCYPAFPGRGFIGRALQLVVAELAVSGAKQIEAHVEHDNLSSRRVVERAGFIKRGIVLGDSRSGETKERLRYIRPVS